MGRDRRKYQLILQVAAVIGRNDQLSWDRPQWSPQAVRSAAGGSSSEVWNYRNTQETFPLLPLTHASHSLSTCWREKGFKLECNQHLALAAQNEDPQARGKGSSKVAGQSLSPVNATTHSHRNRTWVRAPRTPSLGTGEH